MSEKDSAVKLPMEDLRFLESCRRIENKCAEMYWHFRRIFAGVEEFAELWKKTALEEENHARQFDLALRTKGAGMRAVKTDVSKAMANLKKVDAFLDQVLASQPTSMQALQMAIRLEELLAALHISSMVAFEDPGLKRFFESLMKFDNGHLSDLEEALRKLEGE